MNADKQKNNISKAGAGLSPGRFWLLTVLLLSSCAAEIKDPVPIYLQYTSPKEFYEQTLQHSAQIYKEGGNTGTAEQPLKQGSVWGVTVPHHTLAADLTASALLAAAQTNERANDPQVPAYKNIFILSPDHYNHGKTTITITDKNLKTTVGESSTNSEITGRLAKIKNTQINNDIFPVEHGISAVLPFSQLLWPQAKVIPILIRSDAKADDLAGLQQFLQQQSLIPGTLLIQSSDFSHYLTTREAKMKDLQTIETINSSGPEKIWTLNQPGNCDSINILWLIKSIQQNTGSNLKILDNRNSQDYTKEKVEETTSYITILFSKNPT